MSKNQRRSCPKPAGEYVCNPKKIMRTTPRGSGLKLTNYCVQKSQKILFKTQGTLSLKLKEGYV